MGIRDEGGIEGEVIEAGMVIVITMTTTTGVVEVIKVEIRLSLTNSPCKLSIKKERD